MTLAVSFDEFGREFPHELVEVDDPLPRLDDPQVPSVGATISPQDALDLNACDLDVGATTRVEESLHEFQQAILPTRRVIRTLHVVLPNCVKPLRKESNETGGIGNCWARSDT